MKVTFHGVRGSVPTPGPSTVRYGGNTVCVEVRLADGTLLVLDGGTGVRLLGQQLLAQEHRAPIHLLITHPHLDHTSGMPFFAPLYRKDAHVVYHELSPLENAAYRNPVLFDGTHFPVRFSDLPARIERRESPEGKVRIGSAVIRRIALNHPGGSDGFRIDDDDGASLCYLTDHELNPPGTPNTTPDELARFAAGASLVIHDAQYLPSDMPDKHGWGHSLVDEVLALGRAAEARIIALHHHDPDRDDEALDEVAQHCANWARERAPAMKTLVAKEELALVLAGA